MASILYYSHNVSHLGEDAEFAAFPQTRLPLFNVDAFVFLFLLLLGFYFAVLHAWATSGNIEMARAGQHDLITKGESREHSRYVQHEEFHRLLTIQGLSVVESGVVAQIHILVYVNLVDLVRHPIPI